MVVRLITARNELTPAFGGDVLRLGRKGARYAFDVELPPMSYLSALDWGDLDDETGTVLFTVPQPGVDTGTPGAVVVAGASQSGATLNISGATPHYPFRMGQFISVVTASRRYLYRIKSTVVADEDGLAALPLQTQLRTSPANLDPVEVATPYVEGYARVEGSPVDVAGFVVRSFTIEER